MQISHYPSILQVDELTRTVRHVGMNKLSHVDVCRFATSMTTENKISRCCFKPMRAIKRRCCKIIVVKRPARILTFIFNVFDMKADGCAVCLTVTTQTKLLSHECL